MLGRLQSQLIEAMIREELLATIEARSDADLVLRRAALDESTFDRPVSTDEVDDELHELAENVGKDITALLENYRRRALGVIKRSAVGKRMSLTEMKQFLVDDEEVLYEAQSDAEFTVKCALVEYGQQLVGVLNRDASSEEDLG